MDLVNKIKPHPLVVLLLGDLLDLVEELPDAELELAQLLLLRHVRVVDGVLADLDVQVDALEQKTALFQERKEHHRLVSLTSWVPENHLVELE